MCPPRDPSRPEATLQRPGYALLLLMLGGAFACRHPAPSRDQGSRPAPTVDAPRVTPAPARDVVTVDAPHAAAMDIGMAARAAPLSQLANAALVAALSAHTHGDYTTSLAGFEGVLVGSPTDATVRYDRACALGRLGRLAEASTEMESLLRLDLVRFTERLANDPDLATLRAAPDGVALGARREAIVAAYRSAVDRGIPVLSYVTVPMPMSGAGRRPIARHARAGIWLDDAARFVPLSPPHDDAFAALWSAENHSVTVLRGETIDMFHAIFPATIGVEVWSLSHPAESVASVAAVERCLFAHWHPRPGLEPPSQGPARMVELLPLSVRPTPDGVRLGAPLPSNEVEVGPHGCAPASAPSAPSTVFTVDMTDGTLASRPLPEGYALSHGHLTVPGHPTPIDVGETYATSEVQLSREGYAAYLLTLQHECGPEGSIRYRHRLLRIDLTSDAVRVLSAVDGGAILARAGDGEIYAQIGSTVKHVGADGSLEPTHVPPWLSLGLPPYTADCGGM